MVITPPFRRGARAIGNQLVNATATIFTDHAGLYGRLRLFRHGADRSGAGLRGSSQDVQPRRPGARHSRRNLAGDRTDAGSGDRRDHHRGPRVAAHRRDRRQERRALQEARSRAFPRAARRQARWRLRRVVPAHRASGGGDRARRPRALYRRQLRAQGGARCAGAQAPVFRRQSRRARPRRIAGHQLRRRQRHDLASSGRRSGERGAARRHRRRDCGICRRHRRSGRGDQGSLRLADHELLDA